MRELCGILTVLRELCGMQTTARRGWPHPASRHPGKQGWSMSEEFEHLRTEFTKAAEEGVSFLQRADAIPILGLRLASSTWDCLGDTVRAEANAVRTRIRSLVVPLYACLAASPLLMQRDHLDFVKECRTMAAALEFRKLRPRRSDDRRLRALEARDQFAEAFRRACELLDFVPISGMSTHGVGSESNRA